MPDMTPKEKREKQLLEISQLEARLQKKRNALKYDARKQRNDYLIVFGLLVESLYKKADKDAKNKWIEKAKEELKDRNLTRALTGFDILDENHP